MEPKAKETNEISWPEPNEGKAGWQTILRRAAVVYVVLFTGVGLLMLASGVYPLVNNGLMPKALLVFVGLALAIALANTQLDLLREQGRNWLRLVWQRRTMTDNPEFNPPPRRL